MVFIKATAHTFDSFKSRLFLCLTKWKSWKVPVSDVKRFSPNNSHVRKKLLAFQAINTHDNNAFIMAWRFFACEGQSIIINREAKKEETSSYVKYATIYFN